MEIADLLRNHLSEEIIFNTDSPLTDYPDSILALFNDETHIYEEEAPPKIQSDPNLYSNGKVFGSLEIKQIISNEENLSESTIWCKEIINELITEDTLEEIKDGLQEKHMDDDYIKNNAMQVEESNNEWNEQTESLQQNELLENRDQLYGKHKILERELAMNLFRNDFLHKKMAEYYKKKKMEHLLTTEFNQQTSDIKESYGKRLDIFGQIVKLEASEKNRLNQEVIELQKIRDSKKIDGNTLFEQLQRREKEIGTGLISSKTGNVISDKLVDRLINRQIAQMSTISELRLKLFKIRDRNREIELNIETLNYVGEKYHLIHYEEMKIENRNYADKIEERDEEINRLRSRCNDATSVLEHVRKESAASDMHIEEMRKELKTLDKVHFEGREKLNKLKITREKYRNMSNKMQESELMTQPIILQDMERTLQEYNIKLAKINSMNEGNNRKAHNKIKAKIY